MELRKLRYFTATAEELSFSRAAKKLYISQPSLSQQILELEKEMEAQLFIRNTQGVKLTPIGEAFLVDVKRILADLDASVERARAAEKERTAQSVFRILLDQNEDHIAHLVGISDAIAKLRDTYSGLNVSVGFLPFDQIEPAIASEQMDIGFFVLQPDEYKRLKFSKLILARDRLCFITHCSTSGSPEDILKNRDLILIKDDDRWNPFILGIVKHAGFNAHAVYADTPAQAFSLVETGHGFMAMPSSEVARNQRDASICKLDLPLKNNEILTTAVWQNRYDLPWLNTFLHEFKAL